MPRPNAYPKLLPALPNKIVPFAEKYTYDLAPSPQVIFNVLPTSRSADWDDAELLSANKKAPAIKMRLINMTS